MTRVYIVGGKVYFSYQKAQDLSASTGVSVQPAVLEDMEEWIRESMLHSATRAYETGGKPVIIPNPEDAFMWAVSEVGEASGALVALRGDWKRNNPDKHRDDDFKRECHQAILMLLLASGDPIDTIRMQLDKWST